MAREKESASNKRSDDLMTPPEVAVILKVERRLLDHWRQARKGPPYIKVGHQVRYRRSDIEDWLEKQHVTTEAKLV